MKIRTSYVSNSSSSSFVINKKYLSQDQIDKIIYYADFAEIGFERGDIELEYFDSEPVWEIEEKEDTIEGSTWMDNFDMNYYLMHIVRVDPFRVKWSS
jgi:hypothetical protein